MKSIAAALLLSSVKAAVHLIMVLTPV